MDEATAHQLVTFYGHTVRWTKQLYKDVHVLAICPAGHKYEINITNFDPALHRVPCGCSAASQQTQQVAVFCKRATEAKFMRPGIRVSAPPHMFTCNKGHLFMAPYNDLFEATRPRQAKTQKMTHLCIACEILNCEEEYGIKCHTTILNRHRETKLNWSCRKCNRGFVCSVKTMGYTSTCCLG